MQSPSSRPVDTIKKQPEEVKDHVPFDEKSLYQLPSSRPNTTKLQQPQNVSEEPFVSSQDDQHQPDLCLFGALSRLARSNLFWFIVVDGSILAVTLYRKSPASSQIKLRVVSNLIPKASIFDEFLCQLG